MRTPKQTLKKLAEVAPKGWTAIGHLMYQGKVRFDEDSKLYFWI